MNRHSLILRTCRFRTTLSLKRASETAFLVQRYFTSSCTSYRSSPSRNTNVESEVSGHRSKNRNEASDFLGSLDQDPDSEADDQIFRLMKIRNEDKLFVPQMVHSWNKIIPKAYIEEFNTVLVNKASKGKVIKTPEDGVETDYFKFTSAFLENMGQFVEETNAKKFNRLTNSALLLLRKQLLVGMKRLAKKSTWKDGIKKREIVLEDLIAPKIDEIPEILYELFLTKQSNIWPGHFVEKYKIDPKSFNSQFKYLINEAYKYNLQTSEILFSNPRDAKIEISNPTKWFPLARQLKRNIIMHVGPTNSGKTYNALKRLEEAESGYFAGPLRLLAREVFERFKEKNISCNLITGEEIIEDTDEVTGNRAKKSCGTVEMISLIEEYDVVVLDEIQMIADPRRGWAWTQALLGVRAKEVHLCGEESSVALIQKIVELTGDNLVVNKYKRLGELKVLKDKFGHFGELQKGDCVVAFSKAKILDLKLRIERTTSLKVAVIYGALPAETRAEQAKAFNSGEADVLVASDAIGMGLNLSIRKVIFSTTEKFDGGSRRRLTVSEIKQISGRAGRFKSANFGNKSSSSEPVFDVLEDEKVMKEKSEPSSSSAAAVGYVTAMHNRGLSYIRSCLSHKITNIEKACLWPPDHILTEYISEFPSKTSLTHILKVYGKEVTTSELFFSSDVEPKIELCEIIEQFHQTSKNQILPIGDQLTLLKIPLSRITPLTYRIFLEFCETICSGKTKYIFDFSLPFEMLANNESQPIYDPSKPQESSVFYKGHNLVDAVFNKTNKPSNSTLEYLASLESLHSLFMVFCWLCYRYPYNFVGINFTIQLKHLSEYKISEMLKLLKTQNRSSK
ncbi:ATP-dependent RNA helicase [Saccharomycopsis crataegensis]|uniref:RNA helicase n=1 Tax=Saccharomycopsis crataegensis TaxID=43959 RepID=A0AAV5QJJ1_9ASCO|nr:ATP-dependent RNA helicase [Saccharomycopsis crataegensis]